MSPADPLAQLHDIVLPSAVSWWPLAWGWWVLLALLLTALGLVIYFRWRTKKRQAYRLVALQELNRISARFEDDGNAAEYLQHLSILLRRTARSAQPCSFPIDIKGEAWLRWLDDYCPETHDGFTKGCGRVLLTGPYEAHPDIDQAQLLPLVRVWLQQHRNQWQRVPASTRSSKDSHTANHPRNGDQQREVKHA